MLKMSGVIRLKRKPNNERVQNILFIDIMDDENYLVVKNENWKKLCELEFELIDAWGEVYFAYNPALSSGRSKVFSIRGFTVSGDSVQELNEGFDSEDSEILVDEKIIKDFEDEPA